MLQMPRNFAFICKTIVAKALRAQNVKARIGN